MSVVKKVALGLLVVGATVGAYMKLMGVSYTTSVAQPELQTRIAAAIPKETKLTGATLHVIGVTVGFDDAGARLRLQLQMELQPHGLIPAVPPPGPPGFPGPLARPRPAASARIPVAVELLGGLAYRPETGEIVIRDAELGTFGGETLPEAFRHPVREVATRVLARSLEGRGITTLESDGAARLVLDRLWIERDRLWIRLKIGG